MKRLIDAVARRLGYVSGETFDDINETYSRRILALGDEIDALKRKITNLTGVIAAADANASATVNDLARKLRLEEQRLKGEQHAGEKLSGRYNRLRVAADAVAGVVKQLDDEL